MKRSEFLLKLQRYYGMRHCMVTERYISPNTFMDEVLELVEELGMLPPPSEKCLILLTSKNQWDKEYES